MVCENKQKKKNKKKNKKESLMLLSDKQRLNENK